jgi:hypothetical protein
LVESIAKTISPIEPLALGLELLDPVPSSQENKKRQHKERRLRYIAFIGSLVSKGSVKKEYKLGYH